MTLLEVRNLSTRFDTTEGIVRAVDGVSFEVRAGETLGLAGESGCGKSVTALSIMRLVAPPGEISSGEVLLEGRDILRMTDTEVRRLRGNSVAMIFQDPITSLNPVLTIGSQITEALQLHLGMNRVQAKTRAIELLRLVGIPKAEDRMDAYPHQFSGGMCQRVMIAIALSCHPRLILADEITTALDVTIQAQIFDLLKELAQTSDSAFLVITHDLGILAGVTQRVHVMYAGQIVEKADTPELFANPKMPYTWGLLRSIPHMNEERRRLVPIEGMPPSLVSPPPGCRFEPRCRYRRPICSQRQPELRRAAQAGPNHEARCWGVQDVPEGGWLIGHNWREGDIEHSKETKRAAGT